MELDEVSRAIGQLEAGQAATTRELTEVKTELTGVSSKLDQLLARPAPKAKLSIKQWAAIVGIASSGGGGIAHALRKLFE